MTVLEKHRRKKTILAGSYCCMINQQDGCEDIGGALLQLWSLSNLKNKTKQNKTNWLTVKTMWKLAFYISYPQWCLDSLYVATSLEVCFLRSLQCSMASFKPSTVETHQFTLHTQPMVGAHLHSKEYFLFIWWLGGQLWLGQTNELHHHPVSYKTLWPMRSECQSF